MKGPAALIIAAGKPAGRDMEQEAESADDEGMEAAAEEAFQAIKDDDAKAFSEAILSLVKMANAKAESEEPEGE